MSIYQNFIENKEYNQELQDCIESTVDKLEQLETNVRNPGMLLGKIQSGKTRAFIGIIALAFDRGYDITIVLTKGTRALAEQTYQRLDDEFQDFIETDDVKVYDIMNLPNLTPYIRSQKLIMVVKKETKNLDRLIEFFNGYPDLIQKKTLIIDDEADFASIGFRNDKSKPDGVSINVLATKLSQIREGFANNYDYLQVTATPYSLYLQPSVIEVNDEEYAPMRPAFTELVPIHDRYIGGEFYFEDSVNPELPAYFLHGEIPDTEFLILGKRDQRYLNNILRTQNLSFFRLAIINYLVAGSIRILQERRNQKRYKSSFIIHTETSKQKHQWQFELVTTLLKNLTDAPEEDLHQLVEESYQQFVPSLTVNNSYIPDVEDVLSQVSTALLGGHIGINRINSDDDVFVLLGRNGQLRLDNPFNIFIGGQILDRGITIESLIGFFYGRNPRKFQQDTVLQHSRMYGARSMNDMAVTRLYTSARIYRAMRTMHEFDSLLREAFEQGVNRDSVVFIEREANGSIVPCAPNKILITSTETIRPFKRFLPVGLQTKARTAISNTVQEIEDILTRASNGDLQNPFTITLTDAERIINLVDSTFEFSDRFNNTASEWDKDTFLAIMRRLSSSTNNPGLRDRVYCLVKTNRNISRYKDSRGLAFTDAPDDNRNDYVPAKQLAEQIPCLILLKQNGAEDRGWRGAAFWYPILVAPQNARTAVYATETLP